MVPGSHYHIYNHANGRENLFIEVKNYNFFLERISTYVLPFLNLHAYCLFPNHFLYERKGSLFMPNMKSDLN
jgi:putative transposase